MSDEPIPQSGALAPARVQRKPHPDAGAAAPRSARLGRLGPLLAILNIGWALPSAAAGTLLQALLARDYGAEGKLGALTAITTAGAVLAILGTVIGGALSDRTRSRFGRRNPWILGGALASAGGLTMTGLLPTLPLQLLGFMLYQGGLNAMQAASTALLPDRVSGAALGRASAYLAGGYLVGTAFGGIAAAAAIGSPGAGLAVLPWLMAATALLLVVCMNGRPSDDIPPNSTSARAVLRSLVPPCDRDFLLAFAGRFCVILSLTVVVYYQLYIYTDYLRIGTTSAAAHIATGMLILSVTALLAAIGGGLLSDRLGRRKMLVVAASLCIAAAAVPVMLSPTVESLTLFYAISGVGYGLYLSVDSALMVEVLPTAGAEAKELGMLSVANAAPALIAPAIATALVSTLGYHSLFLFTVLVATIGGGLVSAIRRVH
ncbi:MFS transporter [Kribbella sp. NPDC055071]